MTEETIFAATLDKQTPTERSAFLDEVCAGDPALRHRIEALIAAHEQAADFLEKPAVEQIAAGISASHGLTDAMQPALEGMTGNLDDVLLGPTQADPSSTGEDELSLDFLAPSEKPGTLGRVGHYHVLAVIGRGGMGVVLKAFDEELQRVVAIKVMGPQLAATGTARKRFRREAQAAAAVRDEHVIDIHAVDEVNGLPYLVMEYINGVSLQDRLDQSGPLELKEILRIGMQTATGLAKAHAQGLIHRDIKPANILLENGVQRVKITDFGLARAVDDASLTQSGVITGTPQYMAPEQARGETVDHRADLFSLGSALYAMCTGRPPFRASSVMAVLKRVCEDSPRPIREINPEIPDWLCAVIDKLHAKNAAQRFQTATGVAELLGQHLAHLQQPVQVPMPPRVERPFASAATAARKPALLLPVLMILTPFLLIPAAVVSLFLGGTSQRLVLGLSVAVTVSVALTGLILSVVRLAAQREKERTTPIPPSGERPAELGTMARTSWARRSRRVLILSLLVLVLGVAAWPWFGFGPRLMSILTHSAILEVQTVADDEFEDLHVIFRGVTVIGRGGVNQIDAGSWAYLSPGLYEFRPEGSWRGPLEKHEMVVSPSTLLLSAGQRYTVKLFLRRKTANSPEARKNAAGSHLVSPPRTQAAASMPFVILAPNNKAERKFATLAEAVTEARSGDIIEIRGDGPFVSPPVFIRKPLTIRAGKEVQPVLELDPAQTMGNNPLLETNAALTIEGLQLRWVGKKEGYAIRRMVRANGASIRAANCRFVAFPDCVALMADWSPVCEVRNCEFLSRGMFGRVDHVLPSGGRLILENNVMLGADLGVDFHYRRPDLEDVAIEFTHNTLVVQNPLALFLDTPPAPRAAAEALAKPIQLTAAGNLLDGSHQIMELFQSEDFLLGRSPLNAAGVQDLLGRLVSWKEQNNVYPESISLLGHFVKPDSQPLPAGKSLADWSRFWGMRDTAAVQGEIRYRGGDLRSRALTELDRVTREDFRLHDVSAGHRAGKDGRDLGADVDLVGPGPAYERWQKTPEYRQWLKKTNLLSKGH